MTAINNLSHVCGVVKINNFIILSIHKAARNRNIYNHKTVMSQLKIGLSETTQLLARLEAQGLIESHITNGANKETVKNEECYYWKLTNKGIQEALKLRSQKYWGTYTD